MAEYMIFTRIAEQKVAGCGAASGDVISARLANIKVTDMEAKQAGRYIAELTDKELADLKRDMHPLKTAHRDIDKLNPNATPEEKQNMLNDIAKTTPRLGLNISPDDSKLALAAQEKADIADLKKKTNPISLIDKSLKLADVMQRKF